MSGLRFSKVIAAAGKGLTIVAKGHTTRLVAVAAAVGIVTMSITLAAGMLIMIRSLRTGFRRIPATGSHDIPRLSR